MNDSLHNVQKKIYAYLSEENPLPENLVRTQAPLSAEQRVAIYKNSMRAALIETLRNTYSVCCQLVGDAFFNAMAELFVQQTPSLSPNINDYGAEFADFIAAFPGAHSVPYLTDVARLEWAWHNALHGPDIISNLADLAKLSEAEYANIIFELPQNASLITSSYPIHTIWQWHQPDSARDTAIDLHAGGVQLLVWRQEMHMRMDVLTTQAWVFLNLLQAGKTIEAICNSHPDLEIESTLQTLVQSEQICSFST